MDPSVPHQEAFFAAKDNLRLYWQSFTPKSPRASVGVIHGYADHSNRWLPLLHHLAGEGFEVHALDYRGHGQADGRRGHVDRFGEYLDDISLFTQRIASNAKGRKVFLLGHSAGGLILGRWLLEKPAGIAGTIFSSPFLELAIQPPVLKVKASLLVGKLVPWLPIKNELKIEQLSRDPEHRAATERDPLYNRMVTPRWFTEALAAQTEVRTRANELSLPSLVLVPEADSVAAPGAMRSFHAALGSSDKTLREYPGGYHELFNDVSETRQKALSDVATWLSERT